MGLNLNLRRPTCTGMGITPEFPGASQIFGEGLISDYTGMDLKSSAMGASLA